MNKLVIIKLSKDFGSNMRGEIAGFAPATAKHILEHKGGDQLAEIDPSIEKFDPATLKVVKLAAK